EQAAPLSTRSRARPRTTRRHTSIAITDPIRALAGVIAVACALVLAWISLASTPSLSAIDVVGARHVRVGQAIAQSGLLDMPAFLSSATDARTRLQTLPAVKDAKVEIALPDAARITLVEREAIGRWIAANG